MVLNEQQNLKDSASAKSIIFLSNSKSVNQRRMLSIVTIQFGVQTLASGRFCLSVQSVLMLLFKLAYENDLSVKE